MTISKITTSSIEEIKARAERELAVINVELNRQALRKATLENDYTELRLEADRFQLDSAKKAAEAEAKATASAVRKARLKSVETAPIAE